MTDHHESKQPLPDSPPNGGSSSSVAPSAPSAPEQHTSSPTRPPPPAGFVYPSTDIHNSAHVSSPATASSSHVPAGPPPPHASAGPAPAMTAYDMPPPSYQAAMSYPAAPTYGGSTEPKYYSNGGQPPIYYQQPQITQTRLPQPDGVDQIVRAVRIQNPAGSNVIVHVQPGAACRRCTVGVITRQTDMCCLLCLIMLTIFTFPFGLIFLCCVPCTVQNRCTNCNRLA